ncbi:MAG: hypothetical protein JO323_22440 [Acidobacteriia bacterium]|nr:hypothetical protein [Terriglobia bacterium]
MAGIACGYLILSTTLAPNSPLRAASVRIWGFRGPLGAFIAAWGGIAMLTSAPFDNWWHDAYGLDVKILSPPHMVLAAGMIGVVLGSLTLILSYMNRAGVEDRGPLLALFLYVGGMVLIQALLVEMELTVRVLMHTASFYRAVATGVPLVLAFVARASRYKWATTVITAIYTVFLLLTGWILPLFPAEPKLGPVYFPVRQFIPPEFPLLLIVPAILLDLFWQRTEHWGAWKQAAVSGVLFLVSFAAVQWPFGSFLNSPAARNAFFGAKYFAYFTNPLSFYARYRFVPTEAPAAFLRETCLSFAIAIVSFRLGRALGDFLRLVRR